MCEGGFVYFEFFIETFQLVLTPRAHNWVKFTTVRSTATMVCVLTTPSKEGWAAFRVEIRTITPCFPRCSMGAYTFSKSLADSLRNVRISGAISVSITHYITYFISLW